MGADASFRRMPGLPPRWALSEHPEGTVWQGDLDSLVAEAWRIRGVGITRWNHSGPTPTQTVHALMAIVTRVLRYARGAVREEDLARVLESRFELLSPARFTPLYADDGAFAGPVEVTAATEADAAAASGGTADTWQRLTANERLLLPYLDEDAHHAAQLLEIGQAQAGAVLAGLKAKLLRTPTADPAQGSAPARRATGGRGVLEGQLPRHRSTAARSSVTTSARVGSATRSQR